MKPEKANKWYKKDMDTKSATERRKANNYTYNKESYKQKPIFRKAFVKKVQ